MAGNERDDDRSADPDGTDADPENGAASSDELSQEGGSENRSAAAAIRSGAVDELDGRIVDLLAWILDTETRAKIYVYLLANPGSTSGEVATGTGLYPSTVREALAELHDEEKVGREKRESEGAGNNPYEYTAIKPSDLVASVVDQVQRELNTIFTLDRLLDRSGTDDLEDSELEPVSITVADRFEDERGDLDETDTADTDGEVEAVDESAVGSDGGVEVPERLTESADDGQTGESDHDEPPAGTEDGAADG